MRVQAGIIPALAGNTLANDSIPRGRGIIPALAGNTLGGIFMMFITWDHPRSRGEYQIINTLRANGSGSSPLSRGILLGVTVYAQVEGIIPALAGNTCSRRREAMSRKDHPRSRGEYRLTFTRSSGEDGSSPLSRGIRDSSARVTRSARIIPALAGNTSTTSTPSCSTRDHPRSRGEYPHATKQAAT